MMRRIALAAGAALLAGAAAPGQILVARGSWAALRFGAACEAAARPLAPASERQRAARAALRFDSGTAGRLFIHLSRTARPGASVMLHIGDQPFLLAGRGDWAWSRDRVQDGAILDALRRNSGMRVESRDAGGRRFIDRYLLAGAPTAIDAAAAGCAGKI